MKERINKLYKPAELEEAIEALQHNTYASLHINDAKGILKALYYKGWKLVKVDDKP